MPGSGSPLQRLIVELETDERCAAGRHERDECGCGVWLRGKVAKGPRITGTEPRIYPLEGQGQV